MTNVSRPTAHPSRDYGPTIMNPTLRVLPGIMYVTKRNKTQTSMILTPENGSAELLSTSSGYYETEISMNTR